jgi:DNA-binding NarL/FixJ family response regulator
LGNATGSTLVRIPRCPDTHCENEVAISDLSPEDLRIIALVAAGYSNRNIARHFSLSESSVYRRVARISDKLEVSNKLELVLFAITSKLL